MSVSGGNVEVVAFDLGGVLVDVDKAALARELGRDVDDVEHAFFRDDLHDRFNAGDVDSAAHLARAASELSLDAEHVQRSWRALVRVRGGAAALVERTRARVTVWSNTDQIHADHLRPQLPERLWADAALSFAVGTAKPAAAFFRAALGRLGVAPERVLFLDDRADNVNAARAIDVRAEQVSSLDEAMSALAAHRVLEATP